MTTAIRTLVGARLRARWRPLLLLAVVGGIACGASAAALAIAERTDSSYRRVADAANAVHYQFSPFMPPQDFARLLDANPGHNLGEVSQWAGFVDAYNSYGLEVDTLAPWGGPSSLEEPFVLRGRTPTAENEALINMTMVERTGLDLGDVVARGLLLSDFQGVVDHEFVITGVGTMVAEQGLVDETKLAPTMILSSAFAEANPELVVWSSAGAILDEPPTREQVSQRLENAGAELGGIEFVADGVSVDKERAARAALRPAVTGLYVVGGLGLVALAAVLAFALNREVASTSHEHDVLRAIGAPSRLRHRLDGVFVATVVFAVAVVAASVYVAGAAAIGPVGALRRFEPDPGPFFDARSATALMLALGGAGVLALAWPNRRRTASVSVPVDDLAVKLVAGSAASRRPLMLGVAIGALGIAASAAVIPYVSSLQALVDEPERYGQPWDAMVRNRWGDQSPDDIAAIAASEHSTDVATITHTNIRASGDRDIPTAAYEVIEGADRMVIVEGDRIESNLDVVMGAETMERLGVGIGDSLEISLGSAISFNAPTSTDERATVTVTGEAVFPAITVPGADVPRLAQGLGISRALFVELGGAGDEPEITLIAGRSPGAVELLRAEFPDIEDMAFGDNGTEWFIRTQPAEVDTAQQALPLLWGGLAVLTLASAAALGLATRSALRAQERDLAVLRSLGATRRQIRTLALKQGAVLLVPVALIGVPIGVATGRVLYARLADQIGVVAAPSTPTVPLIGFVVVITACTAAAVVLAARSVQRVGPALSLRTN